MYTKWVVYNVNSLAIVKRYKQHKAALLFTEKKSCYALAGAEHYFDVIYPRQMEDVEVISAMNGKVVTIKRHQQGGPCDPSTERYWSM